MISEAAFFRAHAEQDKINQKPTFRAETIVVSFFNLCEKSVLRRRDFKPLDLEISLQLFRAGIQALIT